MKTTFGQMQLGFHLVAFNNTPTELIRNSPWNLSEGALWKQVSGYADQCEAFETHVLKKLNASPELIEQRFNFKTENGYRRRLYQEQQGWTNDENLQRLGLTSRVAGNLVTLRWFLNHLRGIVRSIDSPEKSRRFDPAAALDEIRVLAKGLRDHLYVNAEAAQLSWHHVLKRDIISGALYFYNPKLRFDINQGLVEDNNLSEYLRSNGSKGNLQLCQSIESTSNGHAEPRISPTRNTTAPIRSCLAVAS